MIPGIAAPKSAAKGTVHEGPRGSPSRWVLWPFVRNLTSLPGDKPFPEPWTHSPGPGNTAKEPETGLAPGPGHWVAPGKGGDPFRWVLGCPATAWSLGLLNPNAAEELVRAADVPLESCPRAASRGPSAGSCVSPVRPGLLSAVRAGGLPTASLAYPVATSHTWPPTLSTAGAAENRTF